MSPPRLRLLAEDPSAVPPDEFADLAAECRQHAVNHLEPRFTVVAECLALADSFWGDAETGAVTTDFAVALERTWSRHLVGVLRADDEETGVALARALLDDLRALGVNDPRTYVAPDPT